MFRHTDFPWCRNRQCPRCYLDYFRWTCCYWCYCCTRCGRRWWRQLCRCGGCTGSGGCGTCRCCGWCCSSWRCCCRRHRLCGFRSNCWWFPCTVLRCRWTTCIRHYRLLWWFLFWSCRCCFIPLWWFWLCYETGLCSGLPLCRPSTFWSEMSEKKVILNVKVIKKNVLCTCWYTRCRC